ncbi:hypothetical protein [Streptomyces angustmyceticus]|uniref:hypothetical protein n=1 Tax=Streptomyces angustmyceticus TaxID=285578 RepID=UPI003830C537
MTDVPNPATGQVWIDPDGTALYVGMIQYQPHQEATVVAATQTSGGEWEEAGLPFTVSLDWLRIACTYQPPPTKTDPRIARLSTALDALLTEYAAIAAGGPRPTPEQARQTTGEIRAALADVAAIPREERRQRYAAGVQAARAARQRHRRR